tara:strand:+ start:14767 stop:15363 length:597 start_codon:yes stop_codon:yes gene_type:complete
MLQNKYKFNQSSVSLEIIGLPDYSKDDGDKTISIISQWKLSILNRPEIEGSVDHLKSIISAFYKYSISLLLDQEKSIETSLIDIKPDRKGGHILFLKSTKPEVDPLKIVIGNAEFADIINCLDQLKDSKNIKYDFNILIPDLNSKIYKLNDRKISYKVIIPPILAILSIATLSLISINFYEENNNLENKVSFDIITYY